MSDIVLEKEDGVLIATINRPHKKNALTGEMYRALGDALLDPDPEIRAVVIASAGETFCAGNDLHDFVRATGSANSGGSTLPQAHFFEGLLRSTRPIVAAVHGAAIGIGTTMLLHCDLVYASPTARLAMPFVSLGLVPEAGSSLLLPKRVGLPIATEMLLLGTSVEAERAAALHLVNAVVPAPELLVIAKQKAKALADQPKDALRATRELIRGEDRGCIADRIALEVARFSERLASAEAQSAFLSFFQRKTAK